MSTMEGQVAVVTGASQGIGLACALALLSNNARVVAVARDKAKLDAAFKDYGDQVIPMAADLIEKDVRLNLINRVLDQTGQVDVLVANAGKYAGAPMIEEDPELIEDVLTLNVNGVMSPVRAVLPHMVERGTGDVIVIGSIAGRRDPIYEASAYAPSKWAVEKAVDRLRPQVCDKGVRVASISPGPTLTPLVEGWDADRLSAAKAAGQFMDATEVSDAMMYMLGRPRGVAIPNITITPTAFKLI